LTWSSLVHNQRKSFDIFNVLEMPWGVSQFKYCGTNLFATFSVWEYKWTMYLLVDNNVSMVWLLNEKERAKKDKERKCLNEETDKEKVSKK
jgi:hypothetical protein